MGDNDWVDGYRRAVTVLLSKRGTFVDLAHYDKKTYSWQRSDDGDYDEYTTTYGWQEYDRHVQDCGISEWDLASLREKHLSVFQGTDADGSTETGLEMRATCNCGMYADKWVRWVGTAGEALSAILGGDS